MSRTLAFSGVLHAKAAAHLLPKDGCEAAAILLCSMGHGSDANMLVRDVLPVPHDECPVRRSDFIVWPGQRLSDAQYRAEQEGLTLVLIHSHPGGFFDFSEADDASDGVVVRHLFDGWCGSVPAVIGSAVMVPGGAIRARYYSQGGEWHNMNVRIAGSDILHYRPGSREASRPMAFGDGMSLELRRRTACIIGVSGTGSITAEQAARLGFGRIILIDFDRIERKNLNRILNSTLADAAGGLLKVEMFEKAIVTYRDDVEVIAISDTILSREAVIAASQADVIFSCVDSSEGRQIADLIAQAYLIPLIDMGVTIPTRRTVDGKPAVADVLGRIDYVQPGRSSLGSRGVYTPESLRAEYLERVAPEAHADEVAEGYIRGTHTEAPGVIALNMRAASGAMLEYVARAFPFRHEPNENYARITFSMAEMEEDHFAEGHFDAARSSVLGIGAMEPLLGLPSLGLGG
ncbi:ThiF family adenylyltransferase [Sphingomonas crusticola]|uniref:ThiF family adenylyltransferase n=1 Tax=Sphingomonas crusticola TaxID=1697973 RepID=UPI000E276BDB|nr:ThiF family adenylyltransferase [Sphingomonas crusticola]